ncbi:MAG: DUF1549 domain-containing protein, partial [Fuerstia sp.]|nr:DUF1549 domain-containing protein [Fuerstiella sp.]
MWLWIAMLAGVSQSAPVDFDTRVMPILTRAGCNTGACHGAAAGRGGFSLSLYGSRPAADFAQITQAMEGRRIDRRHSEMSLLLLKPTEQLSHEGGTRLELDGRDFKTIQRWIGEGARRNQTRPLREFSFRSEAIVGDEDINSGQRRVQLIATARFGDDAVEDVLPWTVLTPDDPDSAHINELGVATLRRPGRHLIVARFLDQVLPLELIVPWNDFPKLSEKDTSVQTTQSIDGFINHRLHEAGLTAAPTADDAALIRRLTLDLTGRLPESPVVQDYVRDAVPDKRSRLVERLLQSEEFNDFWTHRMALLFRVPQAKGNAAAAKTYYDWLHDCVTNDVPLNSMAAQLLLASGSVTESGPASFYNVAGDARGQAEFVSQAMMGVRLQCANCHDHPLDAWTQDDYHGLAAVFARIKRGDVIRENRSGEVIHPATAEPAIAKIPGGPFLAPDADYRTALSVWMTSADNSHFGKAMVNRVWSHLLGRGLVEPVDDHRTTNPATHPDLLDWLTCDFANHNFQLRHVIRLICNSDVYVRGIAMNSDQAASAEFYASAIPKPMSPEVFMDAVANVTGVASPDTGNARAISFAGLMAASEPLDLLGRCTDACESSAVERTDLAVQLQLLNGAVLNDRLSSENGSVMNAVKSGQTA